MGFNKQEYTKKDNVLNQEARKRIASENNKCLICNKKVSSFCDSHSIPINILHKMKLKNGELIPYKNAIRSSLLTKITRGKRNSSIFKNICRECDQLFFSDLDNMDIINDKWNNRILRLQAARILLYEMYRLKEFSYSYFELNKQFYSEQFIRTQQKGDLKKYEYYMKRFQDLLIDEEKKYKVVYSKVLEYEIDFATVNLLNIDINCFLNTVIVPGNDDIIKIETQEENNAFFNIIYLDKNEESCGFVYFVALPYNGKTKIIMFCDENSVAGAMLQIDFMETSEDKIMNYISATLLIHGNNIYGNQHFLEKAKKCSKFFRIKHFQKLLLGEGFETRLKDIMDMYPHLMKSENNIFNN